MSETLSVTESGLAQQFVAFDEATWPMRQALARNLWAGWQRVKPQGINQHTFLLRVVAEMKRLQPTRERSVGGLWPYLYTGAALHADFTPPDLDGGEDIGRALDRLGLDVETVRGHVEAGNLADVLAGHRAPTTTLRLTTDAKDTLDDAEAMARTLLDTSGLSAPEIRSLPVKAFENAAPHVKEFMLRLGNGDVNQSRVFLVEGDPKDPDAPLRPVAAPVSLMAWGKLNAYCYVCGRTPAESGFPHHGHHMAVGEHEARPGDDTPEVIVWACPRCHIPQPFTDTQTAHSRAYAVRRDPDKLIALIHYTARHVTAYQRFIGALFVTEPRPA